MKKLLSIVALSIGMHLANAQNERPADMPLDPVPAPLEHHGKVFNVSVGVGYYGYVGHPLPLGNINYEAGIGRNFTLAPTISVYAYSNYNYWGDDTHPYRDYFYRETYIPIGLKASYSFDDLLNAGPRWDFYAGASAGYVYRHVVWENGYGGATDMIKKIDPYFIAAHIGSEYHFGAHTGIFLDLSTSVSTIGLAVHI